MLAHLEPSLGRAPAPPAPQALSQASAPNPAASRVLCRGEVVSLVQAMYRTFKGHLDSVTVPGFESFGEMAVALGQTGIYIGLLDIRLAVSTLLCWFGNLSLVLNAAVSVPDDTCRWLLTVPCNMAAQLPLLHTPYKISWACLQNTQNWYTCK